MSGVFVGMGVDESLGVVAMIIGDGKMIVVGVDGVVICVSRQTRSLAAMTTISVRLTNRINGHADFMIDL